MKTRSSKKWYNEYLQSQHWRTFREIIFIKRGRKCERCPSKRKIQLHHKTYERIGEELSQDVEILCEICHKKEHGIEIKYHIPKKKDKNIKYTTVVDKVIFIPINGVRHAGSLSKQIKKHERSLQKEKELALFRSTLKHIKNARDFILAIKNCLDNKVRSMLKSEYKGYISKRIFISFDTRNIIK